MVVCFACFCLILQIMYFYCYVYVFLLLCMFPSVHSVSLCCSVYCLCVLYYCHRLSTHLKEHFSRYKPGVAQRVGRGIALLFRDRGTRSGWVVSSTPRPHFTPGKDQVSILQEAGWAPGPVLTGRKSRPHRDSIPDCPSRSQSLYRLS